MWTTSLNNWQRSQLDQTQNLEQEVGSHAQTKHDSSHMTWLPFSVMAIPVDARAFPLIFTFIYKKNENVDVLFKSIIFIYQLPNVFQHIFSFLMFPEISRIYVQNSV